MKSEFVVLINGQLHSYDRYEDIPEEFDHVIKFLPAVPPGPHTHDEHDEIAVWNQRLQQLMEKERARSNQNR